MIAQVSELEKTLIAYLKDSELSLATQESYSQTISRWIRLTGITLLSDVTTEAFANLKAGWALAPATFNRTCREMLVILRFANRSGDLDEVPKVKPMRVVMSPKYAPSLKELDRLYMSTHVACWPWPTCSDLPRPEVFWRAWLVVSFFTGFRLGDMMNSLTWSCVTDETIVLTASKTGKTHTIPMHPVLERHLNSLRPRKTSGADQRVFRLGIGRRSVLRELARISKWAATENNVTPQSLRRAASTAWNKSYPGAGTYLLGHSQGVNAMSYTDPMPILQKALERLDIPPSWMTPEERDEHRSLEYRLTSRFRFLPVTDKKMVVAMTEKLAD